MNTTEIKICCGDAELPHHVKGTVIPCSDCGTKIFLSASSIEQAVAKAREMKLEPSDVIKAVCIECGLSDMDDMPELSPEQKAFLRGKLGKKK